MLTLVIKTFVKDIKNYLVYLIFLTILIAAITLFSNLMIMQGSYINLINTTNSDFNSGVLSYDLLSLVLILLIIFLGFYAFQFYLNNQARLLSILRLGGSNFYKILSFMFLQLLVIFTIAVVLGMGLGSLFYQGINYYICQLMGLPFKEVLITSEAIIYVVCIALVELAYLILLTIGFTYRHEIKELLRYQEVFDPKKALTREVTSSKFRLFLAIFFIIAYLIILILFKGTYGGVFLGNLIITCIAYPLLLKKGLSNVIKKIKETTKNTNLYIGLSHIDFDFRKMISYLNFFAILLVTVSALMINSYTIFENFIYNICVYLILSIIFMFSLMYQLILNMENRQRDLVQLERLGKTKKDLKDILNIEIKGFFLILFMITFLLPLISFTSAVIYGEIALSMFIFLVSFTLILFGIFYIISKKLYSNMLKKI